MSKLPYIFNSDILGMTIALEADDLPGALIRFLSLQLDTSKFDCDRFPGMSVKTFLDGAREMFAEVDA